mgnify:CR=1 FL=1
MKRQKMVATTNLRGYPYRRIMTIDAQPTTQEPISDSTIEEQANSGTVYLTDFTPLYQEGTVAHRPDVGLI